MEQIIVSIGFIVVYLAIFVGTFLIGKRGRRNNLFRLILLLTIANLALYMLEVSYSLSGGEPQFEKIFLIRTIQVCIGVGSFTALFAYARRFIKTNSKALEVVSYIYYSIAAIAGLLVISNYFIRFVIDENGNAIYPDMSTEFTLIVVLLSVMYLLMLLSARKKLGVIEKICLILFVFFAAFDSVLQFTVIDYLYGVGSFIGILLCVFFLQVRDQVKSSISYEQDNLDKTININVANERNEIKKYNRRNKTYMILCAISVFCLCILVPITSVAATNPDRIPTISGMFVAAEVLIGIYMTLSGGRFGARLALAVMFFSMFLSSRPIITGTNETAFAGLMMLFAGSISIALVIVYMDKKDKGFDIIITQAIRTFSDMIDSKDEYTGGHSYRVSQYAALLAKEMGYDSEDVERVRKIGLLHDCGKLGIADMILKKQGRLTEEEYDQMKSHPQIGATMLIKFDFIEGMNSGALYHHERYDGTGYPRGLKGEDIPEIGRIIAVADAFDAMNSRRCYREKLSQERILEELEANKGKQFDPRIADILINIIKEKGTDIDDMIGVSVD